jgi:twitching motility protein PilI
MEHAKHLAASGELAAEVVQRLAEEPQRTVQAARLAVRVGGRGYLLDMGTVGEVLPVPTVARVPWTRPWFRGLANVRGRLVGVYDLPCLAGAEPLRDEEALQLLVLGDALKVNAALLVTRAFGLRYPKDLDALPDQEPAQPWEGAAFRDAGGMVLTELDLARLAADERFTSIDL